MVMWRIKSCPKCSGDTFIDVDESILFDHCLQCGYMNPRAKEVCPHCGLEMIIERNDDIELSYYCMKCSYKKELHRATNL